VLSPMVFDGHGRAIRTCAGCRRGGIFAISEAGVEHLGPIGVGDPDDATSSVRAAGLLLGNPPATPLCPSTVPIRLSSARSEKDCRTQASTVHRKLPGFPSDVLAHFASGEPIVRYEPAPPMEGTTGDIEALSMWAGQSVVLARQLQLAAQIVAELVSRL
jgi:hypothetical protein